MSQNFNASIQKLVLMVRYSPILAIRQCSPNKFLKVLATSAIELDQFTDSKNYALDYLHKTFSWNLMCKSC